MAIDFTSASVVYADANHDLTHGILSALASEAVAARPHSPHRDKVQINYFEDAPIGARVEFLPGLFGTCAGLSAVHEDMCTILVRLADVEKYLNDRENWKR